MTGPKGGIVEGRLSGDKTRWVSTTPLQAASRYRVTSTAVDADGLKKGYESGFKTRDPDASTSRPTPASCRWPARPSGSACP